MKKFIIYNFTLFMLLCCKSSKNENTSDFKIDIWSPNHSMAYTTHYSINEDSITLTLKKGLENELDTTLINRSLTDDESKLLSDYIVSFPINSLESEYSNDLVSDGDRKIITLEIGSDIKKTIKISNYYAPELKDLFNQINELIDNKYHIHYDKEFLEMLNRIPN